MTACAAPAFALAGAVHRIRLFVYGTLWDEKIQRRVFGRAVPPEPATLSGWRVRPRLVRGRYPGIVRAAGATTRGGILKINRAELERADAYEAAPQLYQRIRVTVRTHGQRIRCWTYVLSAA